MKAKAINDFIIIERSKLGVKKLSSGFEMSESLDDESRYRRGTIIDVGQFDDIIGEGDEVLYDKNAGHGSPDLPKDWIILRIRDLAVVL